MFKTLIKIVDIKFGILSENILIVINKNLKVCIKQIILVDNFIFAELMIFVIKHTTLLEANLLCNSRCLSISQSVTLLGEMSLPRLLLNIES